MSKIFYIILNMRTPEGFEAFARYELGSDRAFAYDLFSQLEGTSESSDADVLHMDLMETGEGLPLNLKVITCTADELAANCRLLTKELFKKRSLD